jgi:hypothetical protein
MNQQQEILLMLNIGDKMQNKYTSRDFYFSAYLLANGCRLQSHTRDRGITTFIFDVDNTKELSEKYYSMRALIEPITYGNALKTLKSIIHCTNTNSRGLYANLRTTK